MKQHPLLLSTPMVLATLAGRKSCTRRTPSCTNSLVDGKRLSGPKWTALQLAFEQYEVMNGCFQIWSNSLGRYLKVSPIYQPGDRIWFKETYLKPPGITHKMLKDGADTWPKFDYIASCSEIEIEQYKGWGWKIKPSMFMPRAACRLIATCGAVSCEHLHDITEGMAIKEGVEKSFAYEVETPDGVDSYSTYRAGFKRTWRNINGPDSWQLNPPVYAIPFKLAPEL